MKSQQIVLFLACLTVIISICDASCCTKFYPFGCDGVGSCNIFCCNCDGGCAPYPDMLFRRSINGTQAYPTGANIFKEADTDENGAISFDEAIAFAVKHGKSEEELKKVQTWFTSIDKNHDGQIQLNEIDDPFKH